VPDNAVAGREGRAYGECFRRHHEHLGSPGRASLIRQFSGSRAVVSWWPGAPVPAPVPPPVPAAPAASISMGIPLMEGALYLYAIPME
jgi:hypothetical protein